MPGVPLRVLVRGGIDLWLLLQPPHVGSGWEPRAGTEPGFTRGLEAGARALQPKIWLGGQRRERLSVGGQAERPSAGVEAGNWEHWG